MKAIHLYQSQKADSTKIWLLFLFLGWSYGSLGQMSKQVLFYITFGGLGIWAIIRIFTLNKAIQQYNRKVAERVGLSKEEQKQLGLID